MAHIYKKKQFFPIKDVVIFIGRYVNIKTLDDCKKAVSPEFFS